LKSVDGSLSLLTSIGTVSPVSVPIARDLSLSLTYIGIALLLADATFIFHWVLRPYGMTLEEEEEHSVCFFTHISLQYNLAPLPDTFFAVKSLLSAPLENSSSLNILDVAGYVDRTHMIGSPPSVMNRKRLSAHSDQTVAQQPFENQ
jgi:hypothetical protein